jgi:hypothetical protein
MWSYLQKCELYFLQDALEGLKNELCKWQNELIWGRVYLNDRRNLFDIVFWCIWQKEDGLFSVSNDVVDI